ncbi:MAG: hypothetical protein AAFR81_21095 [Chloroflexota bacterium]
MVTAKINAYEPVEIVEDYIYESPLTLPAGNWQLTIEKGDAWVFCDKDNFVLHTTDSTYITSEEHAITLRCLYVKGSVKFTAIRFA